MRIVIAHNAVDLSAAPDERDVRVQAQAVQAALDRLGHSSHLLSCGLDLAAFKRDLGRFSPDVVFNLVESLNGRGRLIDVIPSLLDGMGVPYTGAPATSIHLTSNKVAAKCRMRTAGLPTPGWIGPFPRDAWSIPGMSPTVFSGLWIIKSVWEHASIGISGDGLVRAQRAGDLWPVLKARAPSLGGSCFAEPYIDGREFNLALLAGPDGPQVLPPAEILFNGYGPDQPRIVDYRAKWETGSYEYCHTPRRFDFPESDTGLISALAGTAKDCWRIFDLKGYARIDFRVDQAGRIFILEVNTNPCLSPDAGFAAALDAADILFESAVSRILEDALRPKSSGAGILAQPLPAGVRSGGRPGPAFRYEPNPQDAAMVRRIIEETGFFRPEEIAVAMELVEDRLIKGGGSEYDFVFLEEAGQVLGYSCFGKIPGTDGAYDLYWIAVRPKLQKNGLGKRIMAETQRLIAQKGGNRIYVDTSRSEKYKTTRAFYERCGYRLEAVLPDFYMPGDAKAIYCRRL